MENRGEEDSGIHSGGILFHTSPEKAAWLEAHVKCLQERKQNRKQTGRIRNLYSLARVIENYWGILSNWSREMEGHRLLRE